MLNAIKPIKFYWGGITLDYTLGESVSQYFNKQYINIDFRLSKLQFPMLAYYTN